MLAPPLVHMAEIDRTDLNRVLVDWGHRMGPWERPAFGAEWFHGLFHNGDLVAVTATARLIASETVNLTRAEACELGRVCAVRKHLCRPMVRLWREFVFPALAERHGWNWAISYQDAVIHSGNLYRHDGWVRLGRTRSGTDARSGRTGRSKVVWGWSANPQQRRIRAIEEAAA